MFNNHTQDVRILCYFRSTAGLSEDNRRFENEVDTKVKMKRKKPRRRFHHEVESSVMRPQPVPTIHPDDLPQRARWTIIITAGLLLITCMLLVGVTLRMAPVIDELGKFNWKFKKTIINNNPRDRYISFK